MKHSTTTPTKAEASRFDDFRFIGCVACWMLGYPQTGYDVQHLLSGNRRIGHDATIPLCPAHHRGVEFYPQMHIACLAKTPNRFREVFGSDAELFALTDRIIAIEKHKIGKIDLLSEAERVG